MQAVLKLREPVDLGGLERDVLNVCEQLPAPLGEGMG